MGIYSTEKFQLAVVNRMMADIRGKRYFIIQQLLVVLAVHSSTPTPYCPITTYSWSISQGILFIYGDKNCPVVSVPCSIYVTCTVIYPSHTSSYPLFIEYSTLYQ